MLTDNYKQRGLRNRLIKQLKSKGISDPRVLEALNAVPRHAFFDPALLTHAYEDKAFPIGEGQTISQPYTVAFQTEKLCLEPGNKVLEIGTGSGYQACVLLKLGAIVYTIEFNKILYNRTKERLRQLGYYPYFFLGDGSKGIPIKAPFDKIIVTAGSPIIPHELTDQLAENGTLIIPVGDREKQKMIRIQKKKNKLFKEDFIDFSFVPLLGQRGWGNNTTPKRNDLSS